ncbi:Cadmium resistance transcriptional regulatory protein CadC [Caloramator mitchellensis]|uniref:Cadmium resistance transcriptional regulatory protein CadC n=1 Tax=Caloramator mitchellensis TaxID=908809 RepID=A0A0R3JUH2_CALMK|nr:metalloregulator ArsR/SmtB family transcription factor [Caloramator mitchellensis]KRQ87209.1 Cadmium resistance transcriptional regulatory protein CadC [Caloramator mitchellensis]
MEIIEILKALSDETRLRILNLLKYGELCVCEIESLLGITQSNASRHLTRLSNSRLVIGTKKQQFVYYKLNEDMFRQYAFLMELIFKETEKINLLNEDYNKLITFKNSGKGCNNLI